MDEAGITELASAEMKQAAAQRARDRAKGARWDLDVAVFFFAILIIVMILLFQGIELEIVAPSAMVGLALGWLMGWKKGKQLYERFYNEELSKLEQELVEREKEIEIAIEERVQKALRERRR